MNCRQHRLSNQEIQCIIDWEIVFINKININLSLCLFVQVAVCNSSYIGWRDNSLKMVVLITGSGLHFAYDGQLAGVIIPNDMKCHLKEPEVRLLQGLHIIVHFQGGYKRHLPAIIC